MDASRQELDALSTRIALYQCHSTAFYPGRLGQRWTALMCKTHLDTLQKDREGGW